MSAFVWPLGPPVGYNFREAGEYKSPLPSWGMDSTRITAHYLVDWGIHVLAARALLGTTLVEARRDELSGFTYYGLIRYNPHPHPKAPWLHATSIIQVTPEGTPLGKDADGVAEYTDARMLVSYTSLPYDVVEDAGVRNPALVNLTDESSLARNVVITQTDKEKQLTYRAGSWLWGDGPNALRPATGTVALTYLVISYDFLWVQVPWNVVPLAIYRYLVGKVNSTRFYGCEPGTLLFRSPVVERTRLPDGTRAANVHVRMDYLSQLAGGLGGWNYIPDPADDNRFRLLTNRAQDRFPYTSAEFATAFRPTTRTF